MPTTNIFQNSNELIKESVTIVRNIFQLSICEGQLALLSILTIFGLSIIFCLLMLSAWSCLVCLFIIWIISLGLSAMLAIFLGISLNLLLAIIISVMIKSYSKNLYFSATRRQLHLLKTEPGE